MAPQVKIVAIVITPLELPCHPTLEICNVRNSMLCQCLRQQPLSAFPRRKLS